MATNDELLIQTDTQARAIKGVVHLCKIAKSLKINMPVGKEIIHAHSSVRQDFPDKGGAESIKARVIVFYLGDLQWAMHLTLRCGTNAEGLPRRTARLQCEYRYPNARRATIHIDDESGLLQRRLNVLEEPVVDQRYYGKVHKAVWLEKKSKFDKSRFDQVLKGMLEIYAKQPVEFISTQHTWNSQPITSA